MVFQDLPIRAKLTTVIMATSLSALVLTAAGFMVYDQFSYRRALREDISNTAAIIADACTAAVTYQSETTAAEILSSLHANKHIVAAAIYDAEGNLFVHYPPERPASVFSLRPGNKGVRFANRFLEVYSPIVVNDKQAGMLYLQSETQAVDERLRLFGSITGLVLLVSALVALLLSNRLQQIITQPILALASAARAVVSRNDFSVRIPKGSRDELGTLTEGFNRMLTHIQDQTVALRQSQDQLHLALEASRTGIWDWNIKTHRLAWDEYTHTLFGLKPGEFSGEHADFLNYILPSDREAVFLATTAAIEHRRDFSAEFRVTWPDGSVHHIASRGRALYDEMGSPVRMNGVMVDITERKQAEEARSFLVAIVESSTDAVIGKDLQGRILSWNAGAEAMLGYHAEEMIGQSVIRLESPDRPDEEKQILETVQRGQTYHDETVRVTKDGRTLDVSVTISPIRNLRGEIIGASSIVRDITERLRDQRKLRRSEEQMRLIWENTLDGMRLVNEEGLILLVNEAYCRLVEKSRVDLEGQPLSVLFEPHRAEEVMRNHRQRFRERSVPQHQEREVTLWNGKRVVVELSSAFLETEKPALLVTTFRDISRRKLAELREDAFARLARSLSGASSAIEAARVISEAADEIIGWDAFSLDLYSTDPDLIHPVINIDTIDGKRVDVPAAYAGKPPSPIMRQILTGGGQLLLRPKGTGFSVEAIPFGDTSRPSASLIYVPIRQGQSIIGILSAQSYTVGAYEQQDLNTLQTLADQCAGALERVRAEDEVRRMNAELEQRVQARTAELTAANRELEAFTYSVAHDLRAPLRHIDAFGRILDEDYGQSLPDEARRFLNNIRTGSRNMSTLVDDLLNLARVGRQELIRRPVALSNLVNAVLSELKNETTGRSIDWLIRPLPTIECDAGLMKLVFANLLSNAVKYTRPRQLAVIEVGCRKTNGDSALFVRDNGVGFSMKYADKLFGVFQRLHRADEFEGTGVGLATVERIVRKHGGAVWAEAAVDQGATFYFTVAGL